MTDSSEINLAFKQLQKTHEQAIANLTSVQERCTELLLETRALRLENSTLRDSLMTDIYNRLTKVFDEAERVGWRGFQVLRLQVIAALEKP